MEKTTFTYAEMLRAIVCFTLRLRSSSSPLWNEVLSDLIILKVDTNYEPITSQNEERIVGRSGFVRRSNLPTSLIGKFVVECGFRDRPAPEVFFEREGGEENTLNYVGTANERDWARDGKKLSRNSPQGSRI